MELRIHDKDKLTSRRQTKYQGFVFFFWKSLNRKRHHIWSSSYLVCPTGDVTNYLSTVKCGLIIRQSRVHMIVCQSI